MHKVHDQTPIKIRNSRFWGQKPHFKCSCLYAYWPKLAVSKDATDPASSKAMHLLASEWQSPGTCSQLFEGKVTGWQQEATAAPSVPSHPITLRLI